MLLQLIIENYVYINRIIINFSEGLNILTGETGAGKSIIIGALNLALGDKASSDIIMPGKNQCSIKAVFDLNNEPRIKNFLNNNNINITEDLLTLQRIVPQNGKSKSIVNNEITNITIIKELGSLLIDIHGQHEHQHLFNINNHIEYYDLFLKNNKFLAEYQTAFKQYKEILQQKNNIIKKELQINTEKDFLEYTLNELKHSLIPENEYNELKNELKKLENYEKYILFVNNLKNNLSENILPGLSTSINEINPFKNINNEFLSILEKLKESYFSLDDCSHILDSLSDISQHDPARIDEYNDKLSKVEKLTKKFKKTIPELFEYQKQIQQKIDFIENIDQEKSEIIKKYKNTCLITSEKATELFTSRAKGIKDFSEKIQNELQYLNMNKASVSVNQQLSPKQDSDIIINSIPVKPTETGCDKIDFSYAPSPEIGFRPLQKIASGGEISRIMLAFKSVLLADSPIATMIFDEIDAGIGGNTAVHVGNKLKSLSAYKQVIVITHLPQIAKYADKHFLVEKSETDKNTISTISELNNNSRINEIARMISGDNLSHDNLEYAKKYLKS